MIVVSDYSFLRNDYEDEPIVINGVEYPSAEHAFQAEKTNDIEEKKHIASLSLRQAREYARSLPIDIFTWDSIKYFAMENVLRAKFENPDLAKSLVKLQGPIRMHSTKDRFWGCDPDTGEGENNIGNILMTIRDSLALKIGHLIEDEVDEEMDSDEEPSAIMSISNALHKTTVGIANHSDLSDDLVEVFATADKILDWYSSMPGALYLHPELEKLIEKLGAKVADAKKEIQEASSK